MAKDLSHQQNHRYANNNRHDDILRAKTLQLFGSSGVQRPNSLRRTSSNELAAHTRQHSVESCLSKSDRFSTVNDSNENMPTVFRSRTEHINHGVLNRRSRPVVVESCSLDESQMHDENTIISFNNKTELNLNRQIPLSIRSMGNNPKSVENKYLTSDSGFSKSNEKDRSDYVNSRKLNDSEHRVKSYKNIEDFENRSSEADQTQGFRVNHGLGKQSDLLKGSKTVNSFGIYGQDLIAGHADNGERNAVESALNAAKETVKTEGPELKGINISVDGNSSDRLISENTALKANMDQFSGRKLQVKEKIVKIRRKSMDVLQDRPPNEPGYLATRNISQVSQDLMRSKEELISRSKQYGLMLEKYKQKDEEKKEHLRSSSEDKTEEGSLYGDEKLSSSRLSLNSRHMQSQIGSQSPRNTKRKSSYMDSWIQSQQSRISNLVSSVKEDNEEDSTEDVRKQQLQTRSRTSSVPPESSLFLSWGRRDGSSFDGDDPESQICHIRSSSGDQILGIGTNMSQYLGPEARRRQLQRDFRIQLSKQASPSLSRTSLDKASGSSMEDIESEDYARPRMNYWQRKYMTQSLDLGNTEFNQSGATKRSMKVPLQLKKETTFDSEVVTNVVPNDEITSPRSTSSPRDLTGRRSLSPRHQADTISSNDMHKNVSKSVLHEDTQEGCDISGSTPPFGNGRIFQERHSHMDSNRHFPIAVVKPLQHERTRSFESSSSSDDMKTAWNPSKQNVVMKKSFNSEAKASNLQKNDLSESRNSIVVTNLDEIINHENTPVRSQAIAVYNAGMSPTGMHNDGLPVQSQSALTNKCPSIQLSPASAENSNIILKSFESEECMTSFGLNEKAVDVEIQPVPNKNFIMQEFEWYTPRSKNTFNKPDSNPRDSTQDKLEKYGKQKRGSKLMESKYVSSISKSLENLSKIGKDYIKSRKKSVDHKTQKNATSSQGIQEKNQLKPSKKHLKEKPAKSVGDLELNNEFAMRMERRSRRFSVEEQADVKGAGKTRESKTNDSKLNHVVENEVDREKDRQREGKENVFKLEHYKEFEDSSNPNIEYRKFLEAPSISFRDNHVTNDDLPSDNFLSSKEDHWKKVEPRYDPSIVENEVGDQEGQARYEVDVNDNSQHEDQAELCDAQICQKETDGSSYLEHKKTSNQDSGTSGDFVDVDSDDDEQKEMAVIARKISTLRSSQYKINCRSGTGSNKQTVPAVTSDGQTEAASYAGREDVDLPHEEDALLTHAQAVDTVENTCPFPLETKQDNDDSNAVKRISNSLSRVMTDLRELREQDMTLASQLLGLGKSIKHFKKQKKEMEDFYAMIGSEEEDSDEESGSDYDDDDDV